MSTNSEREIIIEQSADNISEESVQSKRNDMFMPVSNVNTKAQVFLEYIYSMDDDAARTVVQCGWQTESIIHQILFSGTIACIHSSDLRNRHMRLIYDQQEIITEEIQQCARSLPGFSAG